MAPIASQLFLLDGADELLAVAASAGRATISARFRASICVGYALLVGASAVGVGHILQARIAPAAVAIHGGRAAMPTNAARARIPSL